MKSRFALSAAFLLLSISSYAVELVTNGDFEGAPLGTGWTESSAGGFPIIGDWSGLDPNAPTTNTAWLGGYEDAVDSVTQSLDSTGYVTGTLSFDVTVNNVDVPGFDFLDVTLGGTNVLSLDLGDFEPVDFYLHHFDLDVSALLGGPQDLVFTVTTDDSLNSSAFIDNVSLNAQQPVPEPASMAALGFGALALLRRRRKS